MVQAADALAYATQNGKRIGEALVELELSTEDDVVKALALGAKAVGVGRPYAYGAALGGTDGIVHVLRSLLAEADLLMAIDGYPTLADLTPEALRRVRQ